MSDQDEALRIAEDLGRGWAYKTECAEAAAILRRQHAEIERLRAENDALRAERDALRAERDALWITHNDMCKRISAALAAKEAK